MTEKNSPATYQVLASKKQTQEKVRAELARLEAHLPSLKARVAKAREVVHQAKLAAVVAQGTPGFEDDEKAAASVQRALAEQEAAGLALDEAEDQLDVLGKGSKQLKAEVDQLTTRLEQEHRARCKAELTERIANATPALMTFISDVTALRALNAEPTWPQELGDIIERQLGIPLQQAIKAGHAVSDRVLAGGEVGP